jgi:amino acid adenylation domain-containing protein
MIMEELERKFWQEKLAAGAAAGNVFLERERKPFRSYFRDELELSIAPEVGTRVFEVAAQHGVDAFTVLILAFHLFLARYGGIDDPAVGTIVDGEGDGRLVGVFCDIPVTADVAVACTCMKKALDEAMRAAPYGEVLEAMGIDGASGPAPFFQTLLIARGMEAGSDFECSERAIERWQEEIRNRDLVLFAAVEGEGIVLRAEYDSELWTHGGLAQFLQHFARFAGGLLGSPTRVARVAVCEDFTAHQACGAAKAEEAEMFPALFARQVARVPEAIAAECGDIQLSYAALDELSDDFAAELGSAGLRSEDVVAFLFPRGLDYLVAILGALKAGCAYVPLDGRDPASRLAGILERSGARVLVVDEENHSRLAGHLPKAMLVFAASRLLHRKGSSQGFPGVAIHPRNLAYVIYTSGSTGEPKGAMIEHRGMVNHLFAKIEDLGLSEGDVLIQNASACFDISVWQFLAALVVGGKVVVVEDEIAETPRLLLRQVEKSRVTVLESVPSLIRLMLADENARHADLSSLRWLMATGETLPAGLCNLWLEKHPRTPMVNAYGPTECSDDITHATLSHPVDENKPMTIGRPIRNFRLVVVDRHGNCLPRGARGELLAVGTGVGRGYLADPRKTAATYQPSFFADERGARCYRTGDLGSIGQDGQVIYRGRIDHQIKIRGFRIELGEIESALRRNPAIVDGVAAVRPDGRGQPVLIAYLVVKDPDTDAAKVRRSLGQYLPEFMVPAHFVFLESLPLTRTGKVDRAALPDLSLDGGGEAARMDMPQGDIESYLAQVWGDVLDLEDIGRYAHFIELGGHSLAATQVISRIYNDYGLSFSVRDLFNRPVLREFAELVESSRSGGSEAADNEDLMRGFEQFVI